MIGRRRGFGQSGPPPSRRAAGVRAPSARTGRWPRTDECDLGRHSSIARKKKKSTEQPDPNVQRAPCAQDGRQQKIGEEHRGGDEPSLGGEPLSPDDL
eukprot:4697362-Alexandrium_andersonii.AAC.1